MKIYMCHVHIEGYSQDICVVYICICVVYICIHAAPTVYCIGVSFLRSQISIDYLVL